MIGGVASQQSASDPSPRGRQTQTSELISHCGHALRTPLNSILGFAQILALDPKQPLSSVQKERVEQIQTAAWQLLQMIDDAVELALLVAGRLNVSMEPVALEPLLRDGLAWLDERAAPDRVRVETGPALSATVWADPARLKQIITNLFRGVLQCARRGDAVRIGVRPHTDGGATLWMRGDAQARLVEQLESMFLPFDEPVPEDEHCRSVQIGLALAQKLVELMGGRLQVHRDPVSGSELRLLLRGPAAHGAAAQSTCAA